MTQSPKRLLRFLNHPVAQNAIGLYAIQFATILLPVLLVPYLARVLRPAGWGLIVLTQAFAVWLQLIVDYGFGYSGTREIARVREDPAQVQSTVSGILGAKLLLTLAAIVSVIVVIMYVPAFSEKPHYAVLALLIALTQSFNPIWYFQGQERMRSVASLNVVMRLTAAMIMYFAVRGPDDGWIFLAWQAAGSGITATVTLSWMYREVLYVWPTWARTWNALLLGRSMFLFGAASSLYNSANGLILGFFVTPASLGFYGGAERIHRFGISPFGPLSTAFYPHMVRSVSSNLDRAKITVRRLLILMFVVGCITSVTIIVSAPLWVRLFLGEGYEAAIPILQVFGLQVPLTAISRILGFQWLLPRQADSAFNTIVIMGAVTNLSLAFLLVPVHGERGMVASFVISELIVTASMIVFVQRRDRLLWPFIVR